MFVQTAWQIQLNFFIFRGQERRTHFCCTFFFCLKNIIFLLFQERLCAVRCSPDCHVGPWESWSPCRCSTCREICAVADGRDICRENCDAATSTRIRRVVSAPDGEGAGGCPPKVQKRQCPSSACRSPRAESPTDYPLVLPLSEQQEEEEEEEAVLYVGPWSACLPLGGPEPAVLRVLSEDSHEPSRHVGDSPGHRVPNMGKEPVRHRVQKRSDELFGHRVQNILDDPPGGRVQKRSDVSWPPEFQTKVEQWPVIFPPPKVGDSFRQDRGGEMRRE